MFIAWPRCAGAGINEQIHLALLRQPRGVDDGDIVQQDLREGRLQRAAARHQQRPTAGVVAVITRRWCGLPADIQRAEESFHAAADVLTEEGWHARRGDALVLCG